MKKISKYLTTLVVLFVAFIVIGQARAAEEVDVEVTTTLWSGEQTVANWQGAQQFSAAVCSNFKEGDRIAVSVTAVSGTASQVDLRNGKGWSNFSPALNEIITGKEMPQTVVFTLSEDVASLIKANGMVVTGNNFTFNKVEYITTKKNAAFRLQRQCRAYCVGRK